MKIENWKLEIYLRFKIHLMGLLRLVPMLRGTRNDTMERWGLLRRYAPRNDDRLINIWDIAPILRNIAPMLRDDVHKLKFLFFIHNSLEIALSRSIETRFILLFPKLRGLRRRPI